MHDLLPLKDKKTAVRVGEFLVGNNTFDHIWAPGEKDHVREAVLESIGKEKHQYWYIETDGQIIAALGIRENKYQSGGFEMDSDYVAVHKDYRKLGLATRLLKKAEEFVKIHQGRYIHILTCDIDSYKPARAFYEKHAYKKIAQIPDYYVVGEGRIDYFKKLSSN